jgi:DNA-binding NarL/FixJ family response regulator
MIRVAIVDDHVIVRTGLKYLIESDPELEFAGEFGRGDGAADFVAQIVPDVTLLDVRMPGVDGIAALDEILSDNPDAKVIMLSTSDAEEDIFRAVTMGAKGYLLKESDPNRLLDAIRTVAAGGSCLPEELRRVYEARAAERGLTSRESEILRYIAKGYSNEEIADMVHLSLNTVKTHVKSILSNLNVSDRAEAVAEGIHRGIIA